MRTILFAGGLLAATACADSDAVAESAVVCEAQPCCVTGLVTMAGAFGDNSFALLEREASDVRSVYVTWTGAQSVSAGQVVEVRGKVAEAFFARGIQADDCRVLWEKSVLPPAKRVRLRDLEPMRDNLRRICVRGVLQGVVPDPRSGGAGAPSRVSLRLGTADGHIDVRLAGTCDEWRGKIDTALEVEGTVVAAFTKRRELLGIWLEVSPLDVVSSVSDPSLDGERASRIEGVVTYVGERDVLVVQKGRDAVFVKWREDQRPPDVGDEVEVFGFFDRTARRRALAAWKMHVVRHGVALPKPVELFDYALFTLVESAEIGYDDLTGKRISLRGRVVGLVGGVGDGWEIGLSVPDGVVRVRLRGNLPERLAESAAYNPLVEADGVAELEFDRDFRVGAKPRITDIRLYAARAGDVRVVDDSRWRAAVRRQRIGGALLVVLAVGLLLAGAKVVVDRSQRRRMEAIITERKRMSADLHDTIEQNLASAKLMLNGVVSASPDTPPRVADAIRQVSGFLMGTKREIRSIVWNLRNDMLFEKRPSEALQMVVDAFAKTGAVRIRARLAALPEKLNGAVLADLVALVQEALNNVVRHGGATRIALLAEGRDGGFVLRIRDDGRRFDPETAPGPETGHFGLSSMRERARRSRMRLTWRRLKDRNEFDVEVRT